MLKVSVNKAPSIVRTVSFPISSPLYFLRSPDRVIAMLAPLPCSEGSLFGRLEVDVGSAEHHTC